MTVLGDARSLPFADNVAQCVVTSPPYYGLRDYGVSWQIGLEQTPAAYVAEMVAVFREVWRVLRDDGVVWLNLGDSYASAGGNGAQGAGLRAGKRYTASIASKKGNGTAKKKDLLGIPWRVAFALQDDGWYLRSDCIWHKPNPMPESVTDRPTKAHEYVFLLSKSERYFYDAEEIAEAANPAYQERYKYKFKDFHVTRNARTIWTIPTRPYSGAHFATMPPALAERCIKSGSRRGDIVLDPFSGSGTTEQVSIAHGRRFIGTELNGEYINLRCKRIEEVQVGLL